MPVGQVLESSFQDDDDPALRIAFDFDGVLADDASERIHHSGGPDHFQRHEATNVPHRLPRRKSPVVHSGRPGSILEGTTSRDRPRPP